MDSVDSVIEQLDAVDEYPLLRLPGDSGVRSAMCDRMDRGLIRLV